MAKQKKYTLAITGANGLVGKNLTEYFSTKGWTIKCLQRQPANSNHANVTYHQFSLPDEIDAKVIADADVLLHCAVQQYSVRHRNSDSVNIAGTRKLLSICRKNNVKFIFFSTMSAHENAESHYGKCKLALEKIFDSDRDLVLRLGLVMAEGGLFTNMVDLIKKAKVIPLIDNGKQPIQTIAMDDLCRVIEIAIINDICGIYNIAEPEPKTMKFLYQEIADRLALKRYFVPMPLVLLQGAVTIIEKMNIPFGITSENILGLKQMQAFPTKDDLEKFGLTLKSTEQSVETLLSARIL